MMLLFITYSADHNEILHMSRQFYCRDMCKISLWSVEHILNHSTPNFDRISNSTEILLVGWAPDCTGSRHPSHGRWARVPYVVHNMVVDVN